jgi:hypothetical protein
MAGKWLPSELPGACERSRRLDSMAEQTEDRILDSGDRLLIVTRRLLPDDLQHHFVGIVDRATQNAILVHGYAFVHDAAHGEFVRRKQQRSRVFPLDNHIIIFVLPDDVEIQRVHYEKRQENQLIATDGREFRIDVTDFGV